MHGSEQPIADFATAALPPADFDRVRRLLYRVCGIDLKDGKEQLVRSRLWKRVRGMGLSGYDEYLDHVESPAGTKELTAMIDALTTNKTSFFRESAHFDFLREQLRGSLRQSAKISIWSAGCSTGQEPYSIAISLLEEKEAAGWRDARILATDISHPVVEDARKGVYEPAVVTDVETSLVRKYFTKSVEAGHETYRVAEPVRRMIRFAHLNLMEPWPMRGPFDFIFCRNVMIYFDRETQRKLIRRFHELLRPGGYFLVGHSESLTGRADEFTYVQPATYRA